MLASSFLESQGVAFGSTRQSCALALLARGRDFGQDSVFAMLTTGERMESAFGGKWAIR